MAERSGLTALITGASAGLGRDFARLFAADGHDVVLVARRRDKLEELAAELERDAGAGTIKAHVLPADLTDPGAPVHIHDHLQASGIEVEHLVNNAGFGSTGRFAELDAERELDMVTVNIRALTHLTRLFLPAMIARGHGRILNIGSTAGFQPGPFMATYYATKAYVNHFSEALAHELADTGVTVTVSCPGATATEFAAIAGNDKSQLFAASVATSEDVAREAYRAMMKGKRMIVHGAKNRFLMQSLRVAPRRLVHSITAKLNQKAQ
ncbi:MAG TPA: SDR family oxidoreductase [Haliangium sp.]|nr:SDR family oxidoreductase [Haliangium sp.]